MKIMRRSPFYKGGFMFEGVLAKLANQSSLFLNHKYTNHIFETTVDSQTFLPLRSFKLEHHVIREHDSYPPITYFKLEHYEIIVLINDKKQ